MSTLLKCTPRQARKFIEQILEARLVPFLQSSPGLGKSAIHRGIAKDYRSWLIDHRLSSSEPTDLSGFGMKNAQGTKATYLPFDIFPTEHDELPEGYGSFLLFLDEFNSAPRSVQAAAYKLILDRMVGQHKLHPQVFISCAGNLASDRAITNPLSTAMQSRVIHLEMKEDFNEWLEDVALPENYDSRIIAFLSQYPGKLMDFRPDHQERTFCSPRTWEFTNKLIKDRELEDDSAILLTGTITSGVALEFVQFTKVYQELIPVSEIRKDPKTCRLPRDQNLMWAVMTHMMENVTEESLKDLSTYASRFDIPFRILFYRSLMVRHPGLRGHPSFGTAMTELNRHLSAA